MTDFKSQVFVCTHIDNEDDDVHCGAKGGPEIRQRFNRLLVEHGLLSTVSVNNNC